MTREHKSTLTLIGHALCPFVQRVAILLAEQRRSYHRIDIDLADKPPWLDRFSPGGTVPLLRVGEEFALFESNAICEYLIETGDGHLHLDDSGERAVQRCWIEQASALLRDFATLIYRAQDVQTLDETARSIRRKLDRVEEIAAARLAMRQTGLLLIDAAFCSVLRYADLFLPLSGQAGCTNTVLADWRTHIDGQPAVQSAVAADYDERMQAYAAAQPGYLSVRLKEENNLSGR